MKKPFSDIKIRKGLQTFGFCWLGLWVLTGVFSGILASSLPWKAEWKGKVIFPAFSNWAGLSGTGDWLNHDWKTDLNRETYWMAPIPYSPQDLDFEGKYDFSKHWLGTDELGRDVLSCILHGGKTALITGLVAVLISLLIGLVLGGVAGYFGDYRLTISRASFLLLFPFASFAWYYGVQIRMSAWSRGLQTGFPDFIIEILISVFLVLLIGTAGFFMSRQLQRLTSWFRERQALWLDLLILRMIEIKQSIPTLFLILAVAAITEPGVIMTAFWIGITGWTGIARFVRAEMLKIREEPYVLAAQGLGLGGGRILFRHALPNALAPVWAMVSFAIAGAILSEASLSFIREPAESISWGSLLNAGRKDMTAWWLAVWPGLALFLTLFSLQLTGERLRDYFDPRQV